LRDHAIIIDHVNNVLLRHGLPDAARTHTLDSRDRRTKAKPDEMALQACPQCAGVYRRIFTSCPYCRHAPVPILRSSPDTVAGDLVELDAETLAKMRGAETRVDMDSAEYALALSRRGCPEIGIRANVKRHDATQASQAQLRTTMDWWRGVQVANGLGERESYRLFFLRYGVDVLTARALSSKPADELSERIRKDLPFGVQCLTGAPPE
jgi:hypothetical protein